MSILPTSIKLLMCSLLLLLTACGGSQSADTVAPAITLNSEGTVTLFVGDIYTEAGASATDAVDGAVNVIMTGSVNTSTVGSYTLNYSATDNAGNTISVTRTISVIARSPFITTWQTDAAFGASDDNQIMIGTQGTGYDYSVDWGDGSIDEHVTGDIVHTYDTAGTYTVSISGDFPHLYFAAQVYQSGGTQFYSDHHKLRSIEQWGDIQWRSMHRAFADSRNLEINATDNPDLSLVNDMSYMFSDAGNFNQDLSSWDVSNVTDMRYMFERASAFNQDISSWDVSSVTGMRSMFAGTRAFNQDLSSWDVSNVTTMESMFEAALAFNKGLSSWDVSSVTDMAYMFAQTGAFNQELNAWDVSSVTDMSYMFSESDAFNQDVSGWDVSNVTKMRSMFYDAVSFNQNISSWDVSQVTGMADMFRRASAFNQDIASWNVSNVMDVSAMFSRATSFNQDLSGWDVSNVTNMAYMFSGVALSTENYDALLLGWSQLPLQQNVTFDGGNSVRSVSSQSARDIFTDVYGWTITDEGTDTTGPVITLIGESAITLFVDDSYNELGASATDAAEGNVDVVISGEVDTSTDGTYVLAYSATDNAGNTSSVTRTINVVLSPAIAPPVITLNGASTVIQFVDESYEELGASAIDNDGDKVEVVISGTVDTSIIGAYTINYSATDYAGNTSRVTRTVSVLVASNAFITIWKTDVENAYSEDNQITIQTLGDGYDYSIDWGDGHVDENVTGDITHTYASAGEYIVSISGIFPQLYFRSPDYEDMGPNIYYRSDSNKLLSVEQWGNIKWHSMYGSFQYCKYLVINAKDVPDLAAVTSMAHMFMVAGSNGVIQNISNWDVSNVTDMSYMFASTDNFNQDLGSWDVSNVTSMSAMFTRASAFNQGLSRWDVSNVTDMSSMFNGADVFNQDLGSWDVSNVTDMSLMFDGADVFNQDLSGWDVSSVTEMLAMFRSSKKFNQNIGNWDVSSVTDMHQMFSGAEAFNQDIGSWDVSKVQSLSHLFDGAITFNQNIGGWDVSGARYMQEMFYRAEVFNQNIGGWNVSKVRSMENMFYGAQAFNQDISRWNVSSVTNMWAMFSGVTLSTNNYDALLMGWSSLPLQSGIFFSAGNSKYSSSVQGYRDVLTNSYGWTVADGGVDE